MAAEPSIALQLYTLRELAARDLLATLERVAELGYDAVELAGLHGLGADAVHRRCRDVGLAVCGAHVSAERFAEQPDAVEAELRALGLTTIVFPTLPRGDEAPVAMLASLVDAALARGLEPVFHNHDRELVRDANGRRQWDDLVAVPRLGFEVDLGWAWVAGEDPLVLVQALPGRVPLVHVKDQIRDASGTRDCPVGDGHVPYDEILPAVLDAGVRWLVVEQDEPGDDPLAAVTRSLQATRAIVTG